MDKAMWDGIGFLVGRSGPEETHAAEGPVAALSDDERTVLRHLSGQAARQRR